MLLACVKKRLRSPKSSGLAVYIEQTWATVTAPAVPWLRTDAAAWSSWPLNTPCRDYQPRCRKGEAFNILQNVPPVVAQWSTLSGDIHADKYEQQSIVGTLSNKPDCKRALGSTPACPLTR